MSKLISQKLLYFFASILIVVLLTQCSKKNYYNFSFKQEEFASLTAKDTPNVVIEAISPTDESELTNLQKRELVRLAGKMESDIIFKPDSIKIIRYNTERIPKRELFEENVEIREILEDLKFSEPERINRADRRAILGFTFATYSILTLIFPLSPALISLGVLAFIYGLINSIQGLKALKKRNSKLAKIGAIFSGAYLLAIIIAFIYVLAAFL